MRGTIIHYDTLTECGLLRTEAGQLHYFRRDDVAESTGFAAGGYVALRSNTLADTGGSQMDIAEGIAVVRRVEQARRNEGAGLKAAPLPLIQVAVPRRFGWVGGWLSLVSLLGLLLSGGNSLTEPNGFHTANPRLVESIFGVGTVVLLIVLSILFFTHKSRRSIRWTYWLSVLTSLLAYVGQLFDGFEADTATTVYGYSLIALFFAVFFVRK